MNINNLTLIIAVSGGPDSVYLTEKLCEQKKSNHLKLIIAHVNHTLRGKDSDEDEKFVKKLAHKHGLTFESIKIDVRAYAKKHKLNLEEAGRINRYLFLDKIRKKYHGDYIVTAHHKNDLVETSLLNLIRGCGLRGLESMQKNSKLVIKTANIPILRPLLETSKKEILAFLNKNNLKYRLDKSNEDIRLKRNLIRKKLIPRMEKLNPQFINKYAHFLQIIASTNDYLEKQAINWLKKNFNKSKFSAKAFNKLHKCLQTEILLQVYEIIYKKPLEFKSDNLNQWINLVKKTKTNTKKPFGKDATLEIRYNQAIIEKNVQKANSIIDQPLIINGITQFQYGQINTKILTNRAKILNTIAKKDQKTIFIRYIPDLYIRSWQNGDRIQPYGMKGTKKLQDIFTDFKIPQRERIKIPIIYQKNLGKIISVGYLKIAEHAKIASSTKNILKISFK